MRQAKAASSVTQARARLLPGTAQPSLEQLTPSGWLAWARGHGGLRRKGLPLVGQVALFGPSADVARWAGRVERVDPDGTILMQMPLHGQAVHVRMNLQHPTLRRHSATHRVYNHYLETGRTTAQLWLGCVAPPEAPRLVADAR